MLREEDRGGNGEETKEIRGGATPKHDGLDALMVTWETCTVSHCWAMPWAYGPAGVLEHPSRSYTSSSVINFYQGWNRSTVG